MQTLSMGQVMIVMPMLASLAENIGSMVLVAVVSATIVGGLVLWSTTRRFAPAMKQLAIVMDREIRQAEQSAIALEKTANAQIKRVWRQAASVHDAIGGVHDLHSITTELEQQASDLRQMAHLLANESNTRASSSPGLAHHAVASAKQLSHTAERTRETYRRLLSSVNQLVAESDGIRNSGEDAERHAHELTGMVERVRSAMGNRPPKGERPSRKLPPDNAKARHASEASRRDAESPRRTTRREPGADRPEHADRWEAWSGEAAVARADERQRGARHDHDRDDSPPARPVTHQRRDDEYARPEPIISARNTRSRDHGRDAERPRDLDRAVEVPRRSPREAQDWDEDFSKTRSGNDRKGYASEIDNDERGKRGRPTPHSRRLPPDDDREWLR